MTFKIIIYLSEVHLDRPWFMQIKSNRSPNGQGKYRIVIMVTESDPHQNNYKDFIMALCTACNKWCQACVCELYLYFHIRLVVVKVLCLLLIIRPTKVHIHGHQCCKWERVKQFQNLGPQNSGHLISFLSASVLPPVSALILVVGPEKKLQNWGP